MKLSKIVILILLLIGAQNGYAQKVDGRINEIVWTIFSIDFTRDKTTKLLEVPIRIGHLQANPYVSGEIMYC